MSILKDFKNVKQIHLFFIRNKVAKEAKELKKYKLLRYQKSWFLWHKCAERFDIAEKA